MLILAVALAGLTAWLGQQLVNGQLGPQRQRTLALAVAGAAAAVLFGIAIAKAPIVGKAVDHGTTKVADVAGVAYHPADALATPGACPAPTRPPQGHHAMTRCPPGTGRHAGGQAPAGRHPTHPRYQEAHVPAPPSADLLLDAEPELVIARAELRDAAALLDSGFRADLRAVLADPAAVGAAGLISGALLTFPLGAGGPGRVCPAVGVLLARGEVTWPALRALDTRDTDPDALVEAVWRLLAAAPSWTDAVALLVDALDWLAAAAASQCDVGDDSDLPHRTLAQVLTELDGGAP